MYEQFLAPIVVTVAAARAESAAIILRQGSQGPEVTELQVLLDYAGYPPGSLNGIFGPQTKAAVLKLQQAKKLTANGVVGAETWQAVLIDEYLFWPEGPGVFLKEGSRGPKVKELQQRLNSRGNVNLIADGVFGRKTKAAVMNFQKSTGRPQTGIVGASVWGNLVNWR
ncbi:peptidoglycan-binding domain-containing protein [Kamptonema formosum]|uniref:peptidoglycan-binding domain-containing protein n=1 Tax=Kamptonema formosum TaxID=331992 RepID=UPI0003483B00|nr:peptidoglycan-binding protein [Oscillatoria sp. PCC 10802]